MTPSVLIALFTNTPLPGVLEKRALWGSSSLLTQTHTHSQMFPFLIPPIHPFIHTSLPKEGERKERKRKKQLEQAEATAACELEDPIGLFFLLVTGTIDAKMFKRKLLELEVFE
jgi:hypothetical protein